MESPLSDVSGKTLEPGPSRIPDAQPLTVDVVTEPGPASTLPPDFSSAGDLPRAPYGLASDLRILLGRLTRRLRSAHRYGLTQTAVLGRLEADGDLPTGQLARLEGVRPQSMSQTVAELESAGLVSRRADVTDGRRSLVSLTDAGRVALHEDRAQREGFLAELIQERLNDEERAVLEHALELLRRISDV